MFVTFEGIEGTGKTTQVRRLAAWLEKNGHEVLVTREPGTTALGARLRALLMDKNFAAGNFAEALLFLADRADHSAKVILPALVAGRIVVCDRYWHSTMVYQGAMVGPAAAYWVAETQRRLARSMEKALVDESLNGLREMLLTPDLTIVLDCAPQVALARLKTRAEENDTRFDAKPLSYHGKARSAFLRLANEHIGAGRIVAVDADQSEDLVAASVQALVVGDARQEVAGGHCR